MRVVTALAAALAVMLTVTLVTTAPGGAPSRSQAGDGDPDDATFVQGPEQVAFAELEPFTACDELLDYVQSHALEQVGPYGLHGGHVVYGAMATEAEEATDGMGGADTTQAGSAERTAAAVPQAEGEQSFSGTNVQERGVDEPDIVKTDGRRLFTVIGRELHAFDVTSATPTRLGSLRLDQEWGNELLLDGDRLLVLATAHLDGGFPGRPIPMVDDVAGSRMIAPMGTPTTVLTMVDVSDPAAMRETDTLTLDGSYLSARLVEGTARVVVRAEPTGLPFVFPEGGGLRAEEEATERNREIIRQSTPENWLPFYIHTDATGQRTDGTLLDCDDVHHPQEFAGLGTVNVLSIPLGGGLLPEGATAVLASGETISASTDRLYVATNRWFDPATIRPESPDEDFSTDIHAFDITEPSARYVGSGTVPGHLLNQFAMSEHGGFLRVASTLGSPWGGDVDRSESRVTVLAEGEQALEEVGAVDGLGLDERIYAVRFLGDIGYVVTFRQIDPLYTIDLSDPTSPTVRGELKIPGYSAYLHPIGEDLVLGVGQDATEEGRPLGAQLSLFDVSNLEAPQRIATHALGEPTDGTFAPGAWEPAMTPVEYDHRAFLFWPPTNTAFVPYQQGRYDEATQRYEARSEVAAVIVDRAGFTERGRVSHLAQVAPDGPGTPRYDELAWRATVHRSVVVGETLLTVSELGVLASDLGDLTPQGWAAFES